MGSKPSQVDCTPAHLQLPPVRFAIMSICLKAPQVIHSINLIVNAISRKSDTRD